MQRYSLLALFAFLAFPAYAADKGGRIERDEAVTLNWSGPYIGAHAGYGWGSASTTQDKADWGTDPKFIGPFNYDTKGAFGGVTAGYNAQMGAVVVGVELDAGWMGIEGSRKSDSSNPAYHVNHSIEGGMYALPAVRLGFAVGKALVYGKGGYVWIDGEQSMTTTKPGFKTVASQELEGWAYGGGLEYSLGAGWSVKAEYLRLDLKNLNAAQVSVSDFPTGHVYENHTKLDAVDTLKLGINYRF